MKFTWFNLMPWPYLPDDFREKNRSVWVDIDQRLFDPVKSHAVYNDLHGPARIRRHGRLRRDRRERAPPERLRHHALAEHHRRRPGAPHQGRGAAWCWATPSPSTIRPSAWPKSSPCSTASPAAGWSAGFPVGTSMDTNFCYGQIPALTREKYCRGARADHQGLARARAVRLQRPLHQAAPRQHLAAADPAAPSADPHPRRRLGRDLRLLHRQHLFLLVPQLHRLHPRQGADGRLLGPGGQAQRAGQLALPRRLRPDDLRRRDRRGGRAPLQADTCSTSTIAACTSIRASPMRRAIAPSRPSRRARCRNTRRRAAASPI